MKLKYCSVMSARGKIPQHVKDTLEEQPARSGMYNWIFVFGGDILTYDQAIENLDKYDAVQVNMSPIDMTIIPELRRKLDNSSTNLILNNDYVCEYWGKWNNVAPFQFDNLQRMGDMVFSTEPHQVSNMINGTYVIPHPSNTEVLKKVGTDLERDSIGTIFHWWAGQTYLPFRTVNKIKDIFGIKQSRLFGHIPHYDEMESYAKIMFDSVIDTVSFPDFAEMIQGEKVLYDPNPYHTYGRNGVELACWKKPIVGSDRVFSYRKLFPGLCCDPFDFNDTKDKFDKVFNHSSMVDNMLDWAYDEVEFFNYKNSKERFMKAYDEAIDRGGHEWYKKQM